MADLKRFISCLLVALSYLIPSCPANIVNKNQHINVILFGANGNLATKYLWQAIFDVYNDRNFASMDKDGLNLQSNHSFSFIGVGRSPQEEGMALLSSKLTKSIDCSVSTLESLSSMECSKNKNKFIDNVEYLQFTDSAEGYTQFCTQVQKTLVSVDTAKKMKVIMYMAISTTAYVSFLENFKKICHKRILPSDLDIQWALEKPFGVDKMSAHSFADKMETLYSENEIHHVDHYLQKSVVKTILPFRYLNKDLERLWNKDHIERVEIFLKETLDARGRASFYNSMGVLRDIHQSHLTELLTLVAMEIPTDVTNAREIMQQKGKLIRSVESVKKDNTVFGQYSNYANHVSLEMSNDTETSNIPTFAAVVIKINEARWRGVPFILVSGKQLDRRESYVRVVFKDDRVCVSGCQHNIYSGIQNGGSKPQVVFHIGHGDFTRPAILVSKHLGKEVLWPSNIMGKNPVDLELDDLLKNRRGLYGAPLDTFFVGVVHQDLPAYHSVIGDLVDGTSSHFVNTQRLLLSWHIWDHIITYGNKKIRTYEQGDEKGVLNFSFDEDFRLVFDQDVPEPTIVLEKEKSKLGEGDNIVDVVVSDEDHHSSPALFLGWKLVTSTSSLLPGLLAEAIAKAARAEVKIKGSFHMALSGGTSIVPVLHSLATLSASLPWEAVHIWQVDERCVPHHDDEHSNFGTLERELIRQVDIPFSNVHSMPVDIAGDLCDESLGGAHLYTEAIRSHVLNGRMDFTILGLGQDGHTASLFPGSSNLHVDSDTWVTITDDGPHGSRHRMTLTLPLINQSKHVAVLVTGLHKREILSRLESSRSVDSYPILGVRPSNGTLTWFIDDLALTPSE